MKLRCVVKILLVARDKTQSKLVQKGNLLTLFINPEISLLQTQVDSGGVNNIIKTWFPSPAVFFYNGVSLRSALMVARWLPIAPNVVKDRPSSSLTTQPTGKINSSSLIKLTSLVWAPCSSQIQSLWPGVCPVF